jgi:ssDNA-binding replication factor A large subunit
MMTNEQLAPHIEEIARVLGEDKVDRAELARELEEYVNTYRLPIAMAKRKIVEKRGGDTSQVTRTAVKSLDSLLPGERSVDFAARVVFVQEKEIVSSGAKKKIKSGILGDHTKTVPFTAWNHAAFPFEKGETVVIRNAYTKQFRDEIEVHIGDRATVTKAEDNLVAPYDRKAHSKPTALKDLKDGLNNVEATFRILSVDDREVEVKGVKKRVFSGIAADATGRTQFSCWADLGLREGDVVRVKGAYVKSWRGMARLTFDDRSAVEKLPATALPPVDELAKPVAVSIEDLERRGGASDVLVRGFVVDVRDGSGLIFRCPECRRAIQKGSCSIHGKQKGEADLRIKAVLDDGTGGLGFVADRAITERILGKTLDQCVETTKETMDTEWVRQELKDALFGKPFELAGNVLMDDYGLQLIAKSLGPVDVDVAREVEKYLATTGA